MSNPPMSNPLGRTNKRSIPAAITLFFLAPIVAEFLLGDFPATWLALLIILAPMYGGGAILIRELTRRSGRGWPTILLLGVAYAIIEEAFTTQSLFNTHYLGMHLLSHAWIPSLGISAWWTLFMFNVHPFWSIGVSIALTEGLFSSQKGLSLSPDGLHSASAPSPWLGNIGLSVATLLFTAGAVFNTTYQLHHDPFRATHAQFLVAALLVVAFIAAAFLIPASSTKNMSASGRNSSTTRALPVPSPWIIGAATFILGAAVFLAPVQLDWIAVAWIAAADLVFLVSLRLFSRCSAWTPLHTLSVGAGGALLYGVHAFLQPPVVPCPKWVVLPSHILFLVLALAVIAIAVRRQAASPCAQQVTSSH